MTKFAGDGSVKLWTCLIKGYMKFLSIGVLANAGAVNPCVESKTNHLQSNPYSKKINLSQPGIAQADTSRYNASPPKAFGPTNRSEIGSVA